MNRMTLPLTNPIKLHIKQLYKIKCDFTHLVTNNKPANCLKIFRKNYSYSNCEFFECDSFFIN